MCSVFVSSTFDIQNQDRNLFNEKNRRMYKTSIGRKVSSKCYLAILSYAVADILGSLPGWKPILRYADKVSCSKTQNLVLAGIELPLSGLIQQTTKKKIRKKNRYFFYYQENRI